MYPRLVRPVSCSAIKYGSWSYATRRVIKDTPSVPTPLSRSFQSVGNLQDQLAVAEARSTDSRFDRSAFQDVPASVTKAQPDPVAQQSASSDLVASATPAHTFEKTAEQLIAQEHVIPLHHRGTKFDREPYWQKIPRWKDVSEKQFLTYSWQTTNNVQGPLKLYKFLNEVLPEEMPTSEHYQHIRTRDAFIGDVIEGIKEAPMSIRLTPNILSVIDWSNPIEDPLLRQFIPMKSTCIPDHARLTLDSLHETEDSPVPGLVHRYPDKVLFLATSVCGLYCRFCTRSYAVGANTETVTKVANKPIKWRWDDALSYIRSNPGIQDVVVSGGDSYYLEPEQLRYIGDQLLDIPHVRRFRIATKGLCVSPSRTLDTGDTWTDELVRLSERGRERGKQVALHTHFNHEREFTWVTREAAAKLMRRGVVVRNQSVLLRGVNDDVKSMGNLIRELADCNIQPYYVYQCDMVSGVEDLRTPLSTILSLERSLRGSIAGFMMPSFVVDLPGGGGKRLAASYESYDRETGRSTFVAPAVKGGTAVYEYWDPLASTGKGKGNRRGSELESVSGEGFGERNGDMDI